MKTPIPRKLLFVKLRETDTYRIMLETTKGQTLTMQLPEPHGDQLMREVQDTITGYILRHRLFRR
jgi:hypothetical protein